jgi:hypothetical protein
MPIIAIVAIIFSSILSQIENKWNNWGKQH